MMGESPTRPGSLKGRPLVEQAPAIVPEESMARTPTVSWGGSARGGAGAVVGGGGGGGGGAAGERGGGAGPPGLGGWETPGASSGVKRDSSRLARRCWRRI